MNQPIWSHMRVESFSKISGGVGTYRKCQMSGQIGGATRPPGAPTGGRLWVVIRGPRVRLWAPELVWKGAGSRK